MSNWNPNDITDLLNRARRIAFGTAASLVEILQDPQKRDANLKQLTVDLSELADELAAKGQETEMEARRYVDSLLARGAQSGPDKSTATASPPATTTPSQPDLNTSAQEIRELTDQIHSLREDLDRLTKERADNSEPPEAS